MEIHSRLSNKQRALVTTGGTKIDSCTANLRKQMVYNGQAFPREVGLDGDTCKEK